MYLARHRTRASLQKIGAYFGGRDHSSVDYGVNRIGDEMMDDPAVFDEVVALHALLDRRHDAARVDPFIAELVAGGVRRA